IAIRQPEIEPADEIVRRVLIVVEHEVTANRRNLGREADPECPTRHVELMHALVAEVTIPICEVPVPVVVEPVLRKGLHRSRTGPEVVVDAGRNRLRRGTADRVTPFETYPARHVDIAEVAFAHPLDGVPDDCG